MINRLLLIVCLLVGVLPLDSWATPVSSANWARFSFDFGSETPPPPYHNINFQLYTNLVDDVNAGEGITIQAFDANDQAVSNPIDLLLLSDAGGSLESGFGGPVGQFFGVLNSAKGSLVMTNVIGSFDIKEFKVLAANLNYFPPGTPYVLTAIEVFAAPEPTTFALLGLGLVGIAASRRRRLS